jgi:hypothetical protein
MNDHAVTRFIREGAREADRRVAGWLSPTPLTATDRYLSSSAIVQRVDKAFRKLSWWWVNSRSAALTAMAGNAWSNAARSERGRGVGLALLVAAIAHVAMMMAQGPRAGWVWLVVPATAGAIGVMLLATAGAANARG